MGSPTQLVTVFQDLLGNGLFKPDQDNPGLGVGNKCRFNSLNRTSLQTLYYLITLICLNSQGYWCIDQPPQRLHGFKSLNLATAGIIVFLNFIDDDLGSNYTTNPFRSQKFKE